MCFKYLNFPTIPCYIIDDILESFENLKKMANAAPVKSGNGIDPMYAWTDANNKKINKWCNENISNDIYFAIQIIQGENGILPLHKDVGTKQKLCYLIDAGGLNVMTNFYNDERELLQSIKIDINKWHIMDVSNLHEVCGIEDGKIRVSITGKVFP